MYVGGEGLPSCTYSFLFIVAFLELCTAHTDAYLLTTIHTSYRDHMFLMSQLVIPSKYTKWLQEDSQ